MKYYIGTAILIFAIGAAVGHYGTPARIQEKIVTKEVEVKHDNIVTVVTETKHNNGEVTTVTQTTDKTVISDINTSNTNIIQTAAAQWHVSIGAGVDFKSYAPIYMGQVQKNLIGNLSVGVFGATNGTAGVSLGYSF